MWSTPIKQHWRGHLKVVASFSAIVMMAASAWAAPGSSEEALRRQREEMVARQIEARGVRHPRVLAALRRVPRHRFVPEAYRAHAYEDNPLPIGEDQTISQPYIVGLMSELADVQPGERVLEIGTGSGYQAAVLAELASPEQVYTIEILPSLAETARRTLDALGYTAIHTKVGDGYLGWPEAAPFDAIVVTAAPEHVPQPLTEQLAAGGRLVIPVGPGGIHQTLRVITKRPDGSFDSRDVIPVAFVPLVREKSSPSP